MGNILRLITKNKNGEKIVSKLFRKKISPPRSFFLFAVLIIAPASFLFLQCYYSPEIPFIFQDSRAIWIRFPEPVSGFVRGYTDEILFSKDFYLDQDPLGPVLVRLKAFKEFNLFLNEYPISPGSLEGKNWKKEREIEISPWVKSGVNSIKVQVQNPMGPALLWLRIEGLKDPIATDETWKAKIGSRPFAQAILADDTRGHLDSLAVPTPYQSFRAKGTTIFCIFAASVGLWGIGRLLFQGRRMKILIKGALFGITMIWVYLFLANMARIGPALGFDISHHLDYIRFILEKQSIPLASDDWTTFHPPLFYLLSSGFLKTFGFLHFSVKPFLLLKIIPFLCGVGNVWVAYGLARAVFKDDLLKILLAVVFAGFIPMNIYMSAYVGNEPLHAFLAGSSLLMTVHILRGPDIRISQMVYLGLLMGLAVLTKITAWVLVPVVLIFLAYKMIRVDRNKFQEVVLKSGLLFAGIFMISGWYYVRNVIHFGRPFVINWNLPGQRWWQDPGFHTIRYYLNFGEALRHPYFSSFHSFWDSIYSTFWGDGLIAGNVIPDRPDVWNYDYMSTVYLLALPATGIFFIGLLRAIQMVLKKREPTSRLITAFLLISLYSICLFILFSTLGVPIYSQAKAFYCLSVMGPMSVIFALGLGTIHDWVACPRYLGRACLYGWFASLVSMIFLSFGA